MEKKNVWETYDENQLQELEQHAKEYMDFLDNGKTERECIDLIVNKIEQVDALPLCLAVIHTA